MFHPNIIHLCLDPSVVSSLQAATKNLYASLISHMHSCYPSLSFSLIS